MTKSSEQWVVFSTACLIGLMIVTASGAAELIDRNGRVVPGTPEFSTQYGAGFWFDRVLFGSDVHDLE